MLNEIGIKAQKASLQIARLDTELKNKILLDMSEELLNNQENILKANLLDIENSKELKLSTALTDRLTLNEERIIGMSNGLKKIIPLNAKIDLAYKNGYPKTNLIFFPQTNFILVRHKNAQRAHLGPLS